MEMFLSGLLVGIAIGFLWGVYRATQSFIQRIVNDPEEIKQLMKRIQDLQEDSEKIEKTETSKEYRVEWHQNVCYLYDSKDNFLAQGDSITQAMDRAEKRFPGLKLTFRLNEPKESNQ